MILDLVTLAAVKTIVASNKIIEARKMIAILRAPEISLTEAIGSC